MVMNKYAASRLERSEELLRSRALRRIVAN